MKKTKGLLLLGITVIMMFVLAGCGKKTVNLNKYVTITTEGYDSVGRAKCEFDFDSFKKDYSGKIKPVKNNSELSAWIFSGETYDELLLEFCTEGELDKYTGLSNGDVVTFHWDCKDSLAEEYFNVKLKYSDIKYKVKGLKKADK